MVEEKEFPNPDFGMVSSIELPDMEQFEGMRVKIAGWEQAKVMSKYDPQTGDILTEPLEVDVLKIFTEKVGEGKKSTGDMIDIRASTLFNLKTSSDGVLGLSTHPKSNIQKFFKKLKVNDLKSCLNKIVTITVDEKGWLRIVY